MDFDIVYKIVLILAGLGLVVYGIKVINNGMLNLLGHKFQNMLAKNSKNSFRSVMLGVGTTTVLQSSTITNIMANGFLSVGTISLRQAMAISFGTALGGAFAMLPLMLEGTSISFLKLFTIFIAVGAFLYVLGKRPKTKNVSLFLIGFGILCLGVTVISDNVQCLMEFVDMSGFFSAISNPIVMILIGMALCILTQTGYPVAAILIPLVNNGLLSFDMAALAILGVNIGTGLSISFLISTLESNENGKRFLLFNLFVKVFACIAIALLMLIPFWTDFFQNTICGGHASISLVLFNIFNNLFPFILLPFLRYFEKWFEKFFKSSKRKNAYTNFEIDGSEITSPAIAVERTRQNFVEIFKLNNTMTEESFEILFGKKDRKKIESSPKLIERANKLSRNGAIRFCGVYGEKNSEKLKIFVDMFSNQKQILKANLELCEISKDYLAQKEKISPKQLKFLQNLSKDILDMQKIVLKVCQSKDKQEIKKELEVIFKMHDQNEQNMTKAKRDCLSKTSKEQKDNTLFFAIVCEFDKIENEVCDSAIKISLLED